MSRILKAIGRRRLVVLGTAIFLLVLIAPAAGVSWRTFSRDVPATGGTARRGDLEQLRTPVRPASAYPNLDARLAAFAARAPLSFTSTGLRPAGVDLTRVGENVRVLIDARNAAEARADVSRLGGKVGLTRAGVITALMPPAALPALSRERAVRFVRAQSPFVPDQVSGEEVTASGAPAWQARGLTGKDVKVAIIDGGFVGLADRQASGDLPTTLVTADFCGGHFADATEHGTAVTEIVHEMAPDAQLFLACIDGEGSLPLAEQWAKSQGVQIVNFSGHFIGNRGDGNSVSGAAVTDARNSGILWVNSAGNAAQTHWSGTFTDTDGDGVHNYTETDEGNTFVAPNDEVICGVLTWDEWPVARSDFDLYLAVSATGQMVDASTGDQTGTQPPVEGLCVQNTTGADQVVYWGIDGYTVVSNPRLDLFTETPPLQYQTAAGSVTDPAASSAALTVGALCWQGNELEVYSSQGPTIDGRVKPDIAGHDSVSGATYGPSSGCPSGFAGTSASSPEVAGAAALVKQKFPSYGPNEIQAFLEKSALDLGEPGKDNQYGAGQLRMGEPPDTTAPQAKALPSSGKKGTSVKLISQVSDDYGMLRFTEQLKRNGGTIATVKSVSLKADQPKTVATAWKAPATIKGTIVHCVQATDSAGNKSPVSCAKVTLK